jgi:NADPH:quinone reductase-like Zn-dependent oxidoreductase
MSRTIKFAQAGGPEVLEFVETQVPAPGLNELRINVKAIGINRAEAMWRVDDYIEPVKFPASLGYEAAGIVEVVGEDVSGFAAGDEVNVIRPSRRTTTRPMVRSSSYRTMPLSGSQRRSRSLRRLPSG